MKKLLLLVLFLAACRSESENHPSSEQSIPERPSRPQVAKTTAPSKPDYLLKTDRIALSSTGSTVILTTIESVDQAEAILKELRSIPPSTARDSAIASVIRDLAKVDPQQARLLLEDWDDALIGKWLNAASDVARALAESNPQAAASFIEESVPRTAQPKIWAQFLSELPPVDRVAYLDRIPDGHGRLNVAGDLVRAWLKEDPVTCARWMDEFGAGRSADELKILYYAIRNAPKSPADTTQRLTALNTAADPEVRRFFADLLWESADKTERAGLLTELEPVIPGLTERERKNTISDAPAEYAASLSSAQIASFPAEDMQLLIGSWAEKHPEAAFEWAVKNHRSEAAQALKPLYFQEAEKALKLAATLAPGKELDQVLSSLCHMAAFDGRVEAARKLIPLIQDPGQRKATISNVERSAAKPRR